MSTRKCKCCSDANAHYAALNARFDARSAALVSLGFRYVQVPGFDMAAFVRPRPGRPVPATVQAAFAMNADDLAWADRLDDLGR